MRLMGPMGQMGPMGRMGQKLGLGWSGISSEVFRKGEIPHLSGVGLDEGGISFGFPDYLLQLIIIAIKIMDILIFSVGGGG